MVNRSVPLGDTSWKLPTSSHILMRASQVSSEFEKANQSYLRISLGEFFQQRSEALGCLGGSEEHIKRVRTSLTCNSIPALRLISYLKCYSATDCYNSVVLKVESRDSWG